MQNRRQIGIPGICPGSPFGSLTINLGKTVTRPHRDHLNLVTGLCAIYVLGDFDWTSGGHLVLHDLGLLLELSPGDLAFFPSASITHYNLPIKPEATRESLVFYTAGLMFRYALLHSLAYKDLEPKEKEKMLKETLRTRLDEGWDRFSLLKDLTRKP